MRGCAWIEEEYFVTAFVPSETACLESSPGSIKRTVVCTSLEERVCLPE